MKKPEKKQRLPQANVEFATSATVMTPSKMRSLICNPIYAGVGPFPALVDDDTWIRAAAQMIRNEGAEQFLVNMLFVLREAMNTIGDAGELD